MTFENSGKRLSDALGDLGGESCLRGRRSQARERGGGTSAREARSDGKDVFLVMLVRIFFLKNHLISTQY